MVDELIADLEQIDTRVVEMTEAVLDEPSKRAELATEHSELCARFEQTIGSLERDAPDTHQQMSRRISEITLDLDYVEQATRCVSMRLGRAMERRDARAGT